ncbi:hypothetical protein AB0K43_16255 [Kitasatospora sp. NPDC049258]|uniref:SCO2583/SCO2584 N-terminal domain-containing protein n=1 Tax=Kitasatospora sp. NPDC049258 TaxID=3155394 RepID=UPI00341D410A
MPIAEDPSPRPSEEPSSDPFEDLVLDEEFIRGATVKEPSGRSRMLSAKWKRQPPEAVPFRHEAPQEPRIRRRRFGRRATRVDSWGRPKRRQPAWQAPLFITLAIAVTLAALNVDRLREWYQGRGDGSSAAAPTLGPETAAPTAAPPAVDPDTPTLENPWAGSPAAQWPAGADALALPAATAVGVFDKDQVADQLSKVKQFLVAANIDPKTLAGATPQDALALLDRHSRELVEKDLAGPSAEHDPASLFSRFDPRRAVPVTDQVRVQGRITFDSDGDKGVLVHSDVTYVYALRPGPDAGKKHDAPGGAPGGPSAGAKPVAWSDGAGGKGGAGGDNRVEREIVRRVVDFRFYNPARYKVDPGKLVLEAWNGDFGNNVCTMGSGYLEPSFPIPGLPDGGGTGGSPSGPPTDPYDRSKPLGEDRGEGCGTLSRT